MSRSLEPELAWFVDAIPPRSHVVDVGANIGLYSYALARRGHRVEAFEPFPPNATLLRTLGPRVSVHEVGLSDKQGSLVLNVPVLDGKARHGLATLGAQWNQTPTMSVSVEVRTLDSYCFRDVAAIKIDTEGFELPVLRGALATIRTSRPILLVEMVSEWLDEPLSSAFRWVEGLGYVGAFLDDDLSERPLHQYQERLHQVIDGARPLGRGAQTFLFRPR